MAAKSVQRSLEKTWKFPFCDLATLDKSELRVVTDPKGTRRLENRISCESRTQQRVEFLALIIQCPTPREDASGEFFQHLNVEQIPSGWINVSREIYPVASAENSVRLFLMGFVLSPRAGFCRISNEIVWMKE